MNKISLTRFVYLSIAAAIITIFLKTVAFFFTGSVGLLSDALESFVNLAAAVIALFALRLAQKPPDESHLYGHTKAEYFSSITEGILIFVAAISIAYMAIERLLHPHPLEQATLGIVISAAASLINFFVGLQLLKAGKRHRSITLEADAHHLFTDVLTSVAVITGVFIVSLTKMSVLDPIIALLVAVNILYTGYQLVKRSMMGFMDTAISKDEQHKIESILNNFTKKGIKYHALRTRQSGAHTFISVHILVPGIWTVQKGHDILEDIEKTLSQRMIDITIFTHLEPLEDPRSTEDISIQRNYT